jgi:TRAP-type C4-dicarboxylate transport system substrate-binding protein
MRRDATSLIALLLAAIAVAGCGPAAGADKAGGGSVTHGPVVLTLANSSVALSDVPPVEYFVNRVEQLSGGRLVIRVLGSAGPVAPTREATIVRDVAARRFDLGWVGSRVFDKLGIGAFRALSAPMLIDTYPLERAVLASPIPARMLAAVRPLGVTPMGLFGEDLRVPIGVTRPILGPADWRGIHFGTWPSGAQEQAIRALGATPVEDGGVNRNVDILGGRIVGFELDVRRLYTDVGVTIAPYIAVNVHLWPLFDVLIANPGVLASLTGRERTWLREAASDAQRISVTIAQANTARFLHDACRLGARFRTATNAQLAALRRAFAPVYAELVKEPETSMNLREIEQLRRATQPGRSPAVPTHCPASP